MPITFAARGPIEIPSEVEAYNPATDSGLVAWYKADNINSGSEPANNENISPNIPSWINNTAGAHNLSGSGVSGDITYQTNQLNGLPGVVHTGPQYLSTGTGLTVPCNSVTLSVVILCKMLTGANVPGCVFAFAGDLAGTELSQAGNFILYQDGGTGEGCGWYCSNTQFAVSGTSGFTGPHGVAKSYSLTMDNTTARAFVGCVQEGSGTAKTQTWGPSNARLLFLNNFDRNYRSAVQLYEMIVTKTDLTSQMGASGPVATYLTDKWGVA